MSSVFQPIQRGFDNTIANWPVALIFLVEAVLLTGAVVGGIFAGAASLGLVSALRHPRHEPDPEVIAAWIVHHPLLLAGAILLLLVVGLVAMIVHSFVVGGATAVFLDGDRAATGEVPRRAQFRVFSMNRFMAGGSRTWWPVFLIYNIVWGVFTLIILVPVVIFLIVALITSEPAVLSVVGCFGGGVLLFVAIVGSLVCWVWSRLAITLSVAAGGRVREPLREAVELGIRRFAEVFVAFAAMVVASMGLSMVFFTFNTGVSLIAAIPVVGLLMIPLQVFFALIQMGLSTVISTCLIACLAAIVAGSASPPAPSSV